MTPVENQPRGPIKVPDFMRKAGGGICACRGPQGRAHACPCQLLAGEAPRTLRAPSCGCEVPCGCPL